MTAGLFWLAVLFCLLFTVQRSFALETSDGARDGLRLSTLEPAGLFLGKAAALAVELLALEVVLGVGVVLLYDAPTRAGGLALFVASALAATWGLVAVGTLYGGLAAGQRVRDLGTGVGTGTLHWDGRSDSGSPLRSGVYWVRLTAGGQALTKRLVWLGH